jgi:hypothetical protein
MVVTFSNFQRLQGAYEIYHLSDKFLLKFLDFRAVFAYLFPLFQETV